MTQISPQLLFQSVAQQGEIHAIADSVFDPRNSGGERYQNFARCAIVLLQVAFFLRSMPALEGLR